MPSHTHLNSHLLPAKVEINELIHSTHIDRDHLCFAVRQRVTITCLNNTNLSLTLACHGYDPAKFNGMIRFLNFYVLTRLYGELSPMYGVLFGERQRRK